MDGAFGADSNRPAPETNQFRCNACGRYFNTEDELTGHERECRLAKQATPAGRNMPCSGKTPRYTPKTTPADSESDIAWWGRPVACAVRFARLLDNSVAVLIVRTSSIVHMSYYLFKLTPPRPTFPQDMTTAEREVMQAHGAYWSTLADQGVAIVVGPVADPAGAWGIAVVEVADEAAARALAESDPVTTSGLTFQYDIFPMLRALLRK